MPIYHVALFVNHLSTEIRVEIQARNGLIRVTEGEDLTLSCKTTFDWHSCTWKKASIKETCRFEYKNHTYGTWKPRETVCDGAYRDPDLKIDEAWGDQCGKNNRECTITISDAELSDKGEWSCTVQPCETIKGIGCTKSGNGSLEAKVELQVRCINIKCLVATYYDIIETLMYFRIFDFTTFVYILYRR